MSKANMLMEEELMFYRRNDITELIDECDRMLRDWKFRSPHRTEVSPDAVLAIEALSNDLRAQLKTIHDYLGIEEVPF